MANCKDTLAFLDSVRTRSATSALPAADFASLQQLGLVQFLTADQLAALTKEVEGLATIRDAILKDGAEHARLAAETQRETQRTRSILFHFENQPT
ncbi:MAG: hypothetical protein L3J91_05420 [Thermoplasmata archaeon]|nr:hypothetical protein [Thermoplasmata archaeon]